MRIGLLDIGAAGLVLAVIVMPTPSRPVKAEYLVKDPDIVAERIAVAQAELRRRPGNGEAAETLAHELVRVRQTDWALRVAASVGENPDATARWKALLATSAIHVERLDISAAYDWAEKAFTACEKDPATCGQHDLVRLELYATALKAGRDSGIDPRVDPRAFDLAVRRATPMIKLDPAKLPGGPIK